MVFRLAKNVQVRKESWGLLFCAHDQHRIFFVKSENWLYPHHFDRSWTFDQLVQDITARNHTANSHIGPTLRKLTDNLLKKGMIINELC